MKNSLKIWAPALVFAVLAAAAAVVAAVTVPAGPASLVTSPILAPASSAPIGLFEVALNQDAGEILSSITVIVNANASSTVSSANLASVAVYKDNGDGVFNLSSDLPAGSNTTVNVGATTTVATTANNSLTGGKFFVSISTSSSWSDAAPADSITVTLPADAIVTSANSPTVTPVTTAFITADTTDPTLTSATAKNTGGTSAKEAGDSVELAFSEATNKPAVNASTIGGIFALTLNNSHSFLDGSGALGTTAWNVAGDVLTITLSANSATSTVAVGDTVTVVTPSNIMDLAGNKATGSRVIGGSFTATDSDQNGDDEDNDENNDETKHGCANTLVNGKLYKIGDDPTVYLAAACRLKPFRGAAVFHARGHKFQNVITLPSLPANVTISQKPVLPACGTLIKGSDKTVWFVTCDKHRRGFRTAVKFLGLGFHWGQVSPISDADLTLIPVDQPIGEGETHPDGTLLKCDVSGTVYQIISGKKFPFSNAEAYLGRGHTWTNLVSVDCKQYNYIAGAPVTQ